MITALEKIKSKIGMNKINAALSVADQGVVSATNFGVAFILARVLSVEQFGFYVIMFSIWFFINNLQMGFINHGLYVLTHSEPSEYKYNMPLIQLFFSAIVLVVFILASFIYLFSGSDLSLGSMVIYSLSLFFLTLKEYVRNSGLAELQVTRVTGYDLIFFIGVMGLIVIQMITGTVTLTSAWMDFALVSLAVIVIDVFGSRRYSKIDFSKAKSVFHTNFAFSKWTVMTNIIGFANGQVYKYFIAGFLGITLVAAVGACEYVIFLVNPILNGLQNYGTAYLSQKQQEGMAQYRKSYKKYSISVLILIGAILFPVICFPGFFLKLFYSDKYAGYEFLLQVFAANVMFNVFGRLYWMRLLVNVLTKYIYRSQFIVMVATIPVLLVLLPLFEIRGFIFYWFFLNILTSATAYYYVVKLNVP